MKAFSAIVKLTCRSAIRSRFFQSLLLIFLGIVFLMPLTVQTDGTAAGLIRITLEYSFALVAIVLSLSAVWLGASEITADAEDARLHMIVAKPVSRITVYLAKFTGVMLIHAVLLIAASTMIYGLTIYRASTADFTEQERQQLEKEVFVGRRLFKPDPIQMDIDAEAERRILARLEEARARGEDMPPEWETVRNKKGELDKNEVLIRMKKTIRQEQLDILPGQLHTWTYSGLPEDLDGPFRVRYRLYTSQFESQQNKTAGLWGWRYYVPLASDKDRLAATDILFFPKDNDLGQTSLQTMEFEVSPRTTDDTLKEFHDARYRCARAPLDRVGTLNYRVLPATYPNDTFRMTEDGKGVLMFQNLDPKKTLFIQEEDGPYLLLKKAGFAENYCRAVLAVFLEILVFAVLGISFSACFSLPTGIFLTFAYIVLCQATRFVLNIYDTTAVKPHNSLEWASYYASRGVDFLMVDLADFSAPSMLASGELVEFSYLGYLFAVDILARTLPFFLLGIYFYRKRELGIAVKE